jgi:hypothetical protein
VVVDEAQNLEPSVLETIRLLSDFETPQHKLLQIVLSGQPELADKLARPSLRQLRQRVSLLSTLQPLPPEEVARYLNHRLRAAGRQDGSPFTAGAVKMISELSEGIPRNINNIGFNALSMGCALRQKTVDIDVIQQVQADFDLSSLRSEPGVTSEQLARASAEAQSLLARTNPLPSPASSAMSSPASNSNGNSAPMRTRRGEPLNPEDALAYIQEFIRRLKKDQYAN